MGCSLVPSCVGGVKSTWYTLFAHAPFPQDFGEFRNFLLHYTNLSETCRLLPCERCLPLTVLCVSNDKGATKVISSLLTRVIHASIHSS